MAEEVLKKEEEGAHFEFPISQRTHSLTHSLSLSLSRRHATALISVMKERALVLCKHKQREYYDCVQGRALSVAWRCRSSGKALSACLAQHTNRNVLEDYKRKWVEAGKPRVGTERGERVPVDFLD